MSTNHLLIIVIALEFAAIAGIGLSLLIITHKEKIMADELQSLKDAVAASVTVEESAIELLNGLKAALDAAIASNDPAQLQALSDSLSTEKDKLAAAVTANTLPPAQA